MNLNHQALDLQKPVAINLGQTPTQTSASQTVADHQHHEHQLRKDKMIAEEKLRNLSTYLAANSHNLTSPFSVIIGYAEMFLDDMHKVQGTDFTKEYATAILSSSQHLFNLVTDLIDVCNIDAEDLQLHEHETILQDLVDGVVMRIQERLKTANLTLVVSVADDLPMIYLDDQRISQAILNLLSNAIKFSLHGGQINLTVFKNIRNELEVHISDEGVGMNAEDIPKALVDFGKARHDDDSCTGLGLPLAKRLVELHGGNLDLTSQLNLGTTIVLTLPAGRWQNHTQ
ncbi:MAG: hypothetical protein COB46_08970 [Rhodospirillaceae bacterium]|nr:MAG: hypothetical protein COB46_08970 [Rhodospirillaceae bacterium]